MKVCPRPPKEPWSESGRDEVGSAKSHPPPVAGVHVCRLGPRLKDRVWGLGFRVSGLGFGVRGLGFRGRGLRVEG